MLALTIFASETSARIKNAWKNLSKDAKLELKEENTNQINQIMKIAEEAEKIKCPLDMNWREDQNPANRDLWGNNRIKLIKNEKFFANCNKEELDYLMQFSKKNDLEKHFEKLKLAMNEIEKIEIEGGYIGFLEFKFKFYGTQENEERINKLKEKFEKYKKNMTKIKNHEFCDQLLDLTRLAAKIEYLEKFKKDFAEKFPEEYIEYIKKQLTRKEKDQLTLQDLKTNEIFLSA